MHNNSRNTRRKASTGSVSYLQSERTGSASEPQVIHEDSSDPVKVTIWMSMYWGDYFRDTGHLTCEEHGAYLRLIGYCWVRAGNLPDDDVRLALLLGLRPAKWRKMRPTIAQFFQIKDGFWRHKRVDRELESARENRERLRNAGRKGASARWHRQCDRTGSGNTTALPPQCPSPVPAPSPSPATGLVLQAQKGLWENDEDRLDSM